MRAAGLLALIAVWIAAVVLIHPAGNFPLIDDWIYAYGVQSIVAHGTLQFSPYMEATGIAHLAWGSMFSSFGGASFPILRISTLVLAPVGITAVWWIARDLGAGPGTALAAAAAFAFNPVGLTLSATFMTDIPFAVWSALACLFFFRALAAPRWTTIAAATLFAVIAVFVRQQGLAWPAAFVPAALAVFPRSWRGRAMAVAPLAVVGGAFLAYSHWLTASGLRPSGGDVHVDQLMVLWSRGWRQDWSAFPKTALNVGFHWSWYALPIVVWTSSAVPSRVRAGLAVLAAAAAAVLLTGKVAPWGSAVLYDIGIGPVMFAGLDRGETTTYPHAPHWIWVAWTVAAAWAGAVVLLRLIRGLRPAAGGSRAGEEVRRARIVFAAAGLLIFATPMILVGFYDRYLLSTIPITCGLCVLLYSPDGRIHSPGRVAAIALLAMYATFGILTAHDYFSWNRARWQAIHTLLDAGYRRDEVNGGVEYAGLYGMHATGQPLNMPRARVVLELDPTPGAVVCASVPFRRWLLPNDDRIWVLGVDAAACRAGS